ncbi:uncharacterized protein LOC110870089 [Helianthus annuus]|uniref:uncharacterized protein LOC110870089 n=1 Tax=Helianthus annuus TaxID=4232 RepID=UPI000B906717|nr:uncharacterized protein LOC110870089 [Helianthus annuus]
MEFVDPEPTVALEPVVAPDPAFEHDPDHADAPVVAPLVDDVPVDDHPVVFHMPVMFDCAPFATHIDPRYAHTHNGWIDDDDDFPPFVVPVTPVSAPISVPIDVPLIPTHTTEVHRTDLPITFRQDIPLPRPGEGSSRQPFGHVPFMSGGDQFVPQVPHHTVVPPVIPSAVPSFAPSSEPFLWTSPPIMPSMSPIPRGVFYRGYSQIFHDTAGGTDPSRIGALESSATPVPVPDSTCSITPPSSVIS